MHDQKRPEVTFQVILVFVPEILVEVSTAVEYPAVFPVARDHSPFGGHPEVDGQNRFAFSNVFYDPPPLLAALIFVASVYSNQFISRRAGQNTCVVKGDQRIGGTPVPYFRKGNTVAGSRHTHDLFISIGFT